MRILTRYILKAHLGPFLFALSALTGLMLINTVARRFEELAGKGLEASVILEVFILSLPHILALTLPMSVLVAILYAFSQMAGENEITAMKAGGINLVRLLTPMIVVATVLAVGMLAFNDRILPETNHALKNLLIDIGRKSPTLELNERVINEIRTGDLRTRYFLQASQIDQSTNRLRDVVIYDLSVPDRERTIYADSGRMAFNEAQTDLFFMLYDGWINEVEHEQPESFQRLFFEQQLIKVAGVGNELERTVGGGEGGFRTDREMSVSMLRAEIGGWQAELASYRRQAREHLHYAVTQSLAGREVWDVDEPASGVVRRVRDEPTRVTRIEMRAIENRMELLQNRINQFEVEVHKKYAIPFAMIVFVLIGAPLAIRFPRGGVGTVIAISLTIFTVYYVSLIGGESLGDRGIVPPFWAMWAPNVIFLALGILALTRLGKEEATSRGGGLGDLLRRLMPQLRRLRRRPLPARRQQWA